jgi:hypothetical protein
MNRSDTANPITRRQRIAQVALAFAVAAGGFLATALASPAPAAAAVPASASVRTQYLLQAKLDYSSGTIGAYEKIGIWNTTSVGISSINLSVMPRAFGELMSLSNVRLGGIPVETTWTNNSNLLVEFGRTLAPGDSATLTLSFAVRASGNIDTSLQGRLSKANNIMQVSHWFPIVSDGHATRYPGDSQSTSAARRIRVELTTSSTSIKVAAPGARISSSGTSHVYEMEHARDFAFSVSPYYKLLARTVNGVAIGVYYTTGSGSTALNNAAAAIVKYEQVFGQYQWPRYIVAQSGRPGSGNEYPGIVFIGSQLFSDRETMAHETAHQWWYAMAGNDQMREPWLDEGIAEWAAAYYFGEFHAYSSTLPVNSSVYDFPNIPAPQTSGQPNSYDQTIYFKSARFLEGLRTRMGSTAFLAGLRDLFAANRNGMMTTSEFYDAMARRGAPTTYMRQFIRL